MQNFRHVTPPLRLFHGPDSLASLGQELDRLQCQRAVIVCGNTLAQGPLLAHVQAALGERCVGVVPEARSHSPLPSVERAAALLRTLHADAVIAVGGGSAIVTARAASILLAEDKPAAALCTVAEPDGRLRSPRLAAAKLPQWVIPTTPTTAIVKAGSAVLDPTNGSRLALFDPKTRAQAVFLDPQMLLSAPRALIISASLNTLCMAVEGLTAHSSDALAHSALMHALRLMHQHLPPAAQTDDAALRMHLTLAAMLCGQGSDHTAAGITTVLGHALGARHGIDNGIINAIVLPQVLRFNATHIPDGLLRVAAALELPRTHTAADVATALQTFFSALGLPSRLRDVHIPRAALPKTAQSAMHDWFLRGNPRPVRSADTLQQLLEQAW